MCRVYVGFQAFSSLTRRSNRRLAACSHLDGGGAGFTVAHHYFGTEKEGHGFKMTVLASFQKGWAVPPQTSTPNCWAVVTSRLRPPRSPGHSWIGCSIAEVSEPHLAPSIGSISNKHEESPQVSPGSHTQQRSST